ncbi:MAG: DUF192 domain-containing protein [Candidatus Paceibacteria bacterium]
MRTKLTYIIVVAFFISALFLYFTYDNWGTAKIKLGGEKMDVLVAETLYQQHKGLGGRKELKQYDGMLFKYYPPRRVGIVMRDMHFAIDIIWLKDGQVVDIKHNAKPQPNTPEDELKVYRSKKEANMVLEVPAGWAKKHGIDGGTRMKILQE